jgi:hypothetical protein
MRRPRGAGCAPTGRLNYDDSRAIATRLVGLRQLTALDRAYTGVFYTGAFAVSFEMATIFDDARNLLRRLRFGGYLALGEGATQFLIGSAALALLRVGAAVWSLRWRSMARTRRFDPTAAQTQ